MLCGPRLLRRLVEQCFLGPIRQRLEQTSPQLPTEACVPLFDLGLPSVERHSNIRDVLAISVGA